jgi:hypothetical protein
MIHPHTELRWVDSRIGYGVFATQVIPRGTIVWVRDALDQAIAPARVPQMPQIVQDMVAKYAYTDQRGDLLLCWDHGRYVNHSCAATCMSPGWEFEVAVRDLEPGDELTDEYATFSLDDKFDCYCGQMTCRRTVRPDDVLRYGEVWDRRTRDALVDVPNVAQPMWSLVREVTELELVLRGQLDMPSVRIHVRDEAIERWQRRSVSATG